MPRSKFNKVQNKLRQDIRKLLSQNVDIQERAKNNLISNMFFKIKIEDDGKISIDESYKPTPVQVSEDGITKEERQLYGVPDDYMVGKTEADGSCFLDSFLIGLQALGQYHNLSITLLRAICAHVGREAPSWLAHALVYKYLTNNYSPSETPTDFVNRVLYDDCWGEPEIEGRILCEFFSVSAYVLEADGKRLVTGEGVTSVADVEFYRSKTLYFINKGRYHYEPLLLINSNKIHTKDYGNKKPSLKVKGHSSTTSGQSTSNCSSKQNLSSSFPVVNDLQMTPECKQILDAIKAQSVSQLKRAFVNHLSVLYKSTPDFQLITLSLKEALLSSDIQILDLVYEHWATAAHTSSSHRIYNLKRLTKAMVAARDSCLDVLKENRQMLVAEHCLIAYNNFRVQLCREFIDLRELSIDSNNPIDRQQQIVDHIIVAIDTYIDYSDKKIKSTNLELIDELVNEPFAGESNEKYKMYILHEMFELYYCKLDLCIAQIIQECLDSMELKQHLPEKALHDIESALYYYINKVKDDWRPYVPDKIIKLKCVVFEDFYEFLMNPNRAFNCLAMYLEGIKFRKAIDRFRLHLKYATKITFFLEPVVEVDILDLLPCLRDKYSLEKMLMYLEAFSQVMQRWQNKYRLLIIQRVLQVIGECLESKENPLGLSQLTKALLHAHIPNTIRQNLETLTEYFSCQNYIKLIRRIDLEETRPDIFFEVARDIEQIKRTLTKVVEIYNPVLETFFFKNGLSLVTYRINELLYNNIFDTMIKQLFLLDKDELINILQRENNYVDERLPKYGLTFEILQELVILILTTKYLKRELHVRKMNVLENIIKQFPTFISYIENILNGIEFYETVDTISKNDLKNNKCKIVRNDTETSKNSKSNIPDIPHLNCLLNFLGNEIIPYTIKGDSENDFLLFHGTDIQNINNVRNFMKKLEQEYETVGEIYELNKSLDLNTGKTYEYKGIKELTELLSKNEFLTEGEIKYLKQNIATEFQESEKSTHLRILDKILTGKEITLEEKDLVLENIDMNDRCKVMINNLVTGRKRDGCVLQCLTIRATTLKNAFADNNFTQLVQRYKVDEGFRLLVEALLQDIYSLYCEHGLHHLLDNNTTDLLKYSPHDYLNLGNPIAEVILETDARLAVLFRFALNVVEDEQVLIELWQMQEDGLGREEIERKWSGPQSPRLQDYLKLLPQHFTVKQSTEESADSDKRKIETIILTSSKSADVIAPSAMPSTDSTKLVQTSKTSTSCQTTASLSITSVSDIISSTCTAATAAATAASAASTAAQAAASASAALASLIISPTTKIEGPG